MLHDRRPAASRVACACAMAVATAAAPVREPPDAILAIPRAPLVESREHLADLQGRRGGIDVRLLLQPEHAVQNRRLLDAASHTLRYYTQSFGPYPYAGLTIVDVPRRSGLGGRAYAGLITIESRWLVMSGSLSPEVSVARGIAQQWWRQVVDDEPLLDGLVEYSQGLAIQQLFADRHGAPAYSMLEARFFGGFVPWTFRRVLLDRKSAERTRAGRAFLTLERYLGWPALQRSLAVVVANAGPVPMTRDQFFRVLGDAAGQSLEWFANAVFDRADHFDYAMTDLNSTPATDCAFRPCFRTRVVARRHGAAFTGSSREPVGEYESGRAIAVLVTFADGTKTSDTWDGRAASKAFTYVSRAEAVAARIDPDDMLALDTNSTNNSQRLVGSPAAAANRWTAEWTIWFQDLLLSCASLV